MKIKTLVSRMKLCVQVTLKMRILHGKLCWKIARRFVSILLRTDIKF